MVGVARMEFASQQYRTRQGRLHTGSSITRTSTIETTAPSCHAYQPPWKSNAGSELCACALYRAFEHFGITGENVKRMQDTIESPKISVIEINAYARFDRVWADEKC